MTKITTVNTVEGEFSPSSWALDTPPRQNRKFINHVKSNLFPN